MKQMIVLLGVLPFLLVFMMQYALEQQNYHKIAMQQCVYEAKEKAKQDGCFTTPIIQELRKNLSDYLDIPESEILIEATTVPKYRVNTFDERELIHYKIQIPMDEIMAGAAFFGIDREENRMIYTIENYTASELIRP